MNPINFQPNIRKLQQQQQQQQQQIQIPLQRINENNMNEKNVINNNYNNNLSTAQSMKEDLIHFLKDLGSTSTSTSGFTSGYPFDSNISSFSFTK